MRQRCFTLTKAVLAGLTSRAGAPWSRRAAAIEMLGDEHVLRQGVLDRHDRPVAVEPPKTTCVTESSRTDGSIIMR